MFIALYIFLVFCILTCLTRLFNLITSSRRGGITEAGLFIMTTWYLIGFTNSLVLIVVIALRDRL